MADKLFHALTLASIVQREARTDDGRQGLTSVYYNRYLVSKGELKAPEFGLNQMQADPTVQYALGTPDEPWPKWTKPGKDYDVGAYNPYHNPGLPPGPICSPGASALSQSFSPEDSPYFYFIYGKDQKNHYARTLAEQNANIAQYGVG